MKQSNLTIIDSLNREVESKNQSKGIANQFINLLEEIDRNKGWNESLNEKASLLLASSKSNLERNNNQKTSTDSLNKNLQPRS